MATVAAMTNARTVTDLFARDGRVAVVTGASSGLGVAASRGLAEAGADLALGARRVDRLADTAQLVEATGRRALTVVTDVAEPEPLLARTWSPWRWRSSARVVRARQQRRDRHGDPGDPRVARAVPGAVIDVSPQRLLLDGAGVRSGHAAGVRASSTSARSRVSRQPDSPQARLRRVQGRPHRLTRDLAQQWTGRKGIPSTLSHRASSPR